MNSILEQYGINSQAISAFHKNFGIAHDAEVSTIKTKAQAATEIDKGHLIIFKAKDGETGAIGNASTWKSKAYPGVYVINGKIKNVRDYKKSHFMPNLPARASYFLIKNYDANYVDPKTLRNKWNIYHDEIKDTFNSIPSFVKTTVANALTTKAHEILNDARKQLIKVLDSADSNDITDILWRRHGSSAKELYQPLHNLASAKDLVAASCGDISIIAKDLNHAFSGMYGDITAIGVKNYGATKLDYFCGRVVALSVNDPYDEDQTVVDTAENIIRKVVVQFVKNLDNDSE